MHAQAMRDPARFMMAARTKVAEIIRANWSDPANPGTAPRSGEAATRPGDTWVSSMDKDNTYTFGDFVKFRSFLNGTLPKGEIPDRLEQFLVGWDDLYKDVKGVVDVSEEMMGFFQKRLATRKQEAMTHTTHLLPVTMAMQYRLGSRIIGTTLSEGRPGELFDCLLGQTVSAQAGCCT
jgi:hypothetical protein